MTEDVSAGRLYVDVEGDTTGFGREVQRRIDAEMARVRARVRLEVDARRLQADINRAVREATAGTKPIRVEVDRERLARDLKAAVAYAQRQAGKATIGVDADTGAAEAQIDAAARNRKATIDVDADTAGAEAHVEEAKKRVERTPIKVETKFDADNLLRGSMAVVGLMKFPAIAAGINLAGAAIAQLGAGLISLVSAAAPAVNLLGLIPAAGAAIVSGLAPVLAGFSGIGDAMKAMSQQQKQAGTSGATLAAAQQAAAQRVVAAQRQIRDATETATEARITGARQVQSAEQALALAQRSARDAQVALNQARQDAADRLKAYNDQLIDASLNERGAQLAVERAAQHLDEVNRSATSTNLDRREAQLAYDEAVQRQKELVKHNKELRTEAKKAAKAGVEGDSEVIAAKRKVSDANREERDAEVALSDARRQAANANRDAMQNLQEANDSLRLAVQAQADASKQQTAGFNNTAAAMAALSPAGQRFARFLQGTLMPRLRELRNTAQEAFLPPLQRGIEAGMRLLPNMNRMLRITGGVMGTVAENALTMMSSGPWRRDFDKITDSSARSLESLGKALNPLLTVVKDLTVAGGPFIEKFAGALATASQKFSDFIANQRAIGEADPNKGLSGFFNRAYKAGQMLWDLIKDLGGALLNIGQAAAPAGRVLFESLDKAVEKLKALTEPGTEGGNKLKAYFDAAVPGVQAMGRFVNGVVLSIGKLGTNKSIAPLFDQMTNELLPAITDALMSMSDAFGPAFVQLLTDVAKVFGDLGGGGGGLTAAATALDLIFKALDGILNLPYIGPLIKGGLAGLFAVGGAAVGISLMAGAFGKLGKRIAGVVKVVPGATGLFRKFKGALGLSTDAIDEELPKDKAKTEALDGVEGSGAAASETLGKRLANAAKRAGTALANGAKAAGRFAADMGRAAANAAKAGGRMLVAAGRTIALKTAQIAVAAATKAYAAAQWLLNVAMSANPATLIIIALIALGVALVLLWRKSETFRKIVTGAFNLVRDVVVGNLKFLARFLTGWISTVIQFWSGLFKAIYAVVKLGFQLVGIYFRTVFKVYKTIFQTAFNVLKIIVKTVINIIRDIIRVVFRLMTGDFKGAFRAFIDIFRQQWYAIRDITKTVFGGVRKIIGTILGSIKDAFRSAVSAVRKIWGGLRQAARAPVEFIVNTVYNDGIRWAWNKVAGLVHLPQLPEARFAKGGVIPGYAPGQDRVRIWASPGEGVLVPEAVRGIGGAPAVHAINQAYSSRVPGGAVQHSKGGAPAFDIGGVLGGVGGALKGAGGAVVGGAGWVAGQALDLIRRGAAEAIAGLLGPVRGRLNSVKDGSGWRAMLAGLFNTLIDKVIDKIRGSTKESPPPEGKAAGGVVGGMPSKQDRVPTWLRPGEGILDPSATAALGGASGISALNHDPLGALLAAGRQAAGGSAPVMIDRSVTFEDGAIRVDNPVAEPASDSINTRMRRLAETGAFG